MHNVVGGYSRPLIEVEPSSREIAILVAKRWKSDSITFIDEDVGGIQTSHDDAMVISLTIDNYEVKHVLVDNESSADILFYEVFQKINLSL